MNQNFIGFNSKKKIVCPAYPSACWKKTTTKSGSCQSGYSDGGLVCWSRCTGSSSHDCGAFCASSAVHCAKLTLTFISKGVDTFNSVNNLQSNWNPEAPKLEKAEQLGKFAGEVAKISQDFVFPSNIFTFTDNML